MPEADSAMAKKVLSRYITRHQGTARIFSSSQ
jgi:hypothetical protein